MRTSEGTLHGSLYIIPSELWDNVAILMGPLWVLWESNREALALERFRLHLHCKEDGASPRVKRGPGLQHIATDMSASLGYHAESEICACGQRQHFVTTPGKRCSVVHALQEDSGELVPKAVKCFWC